MGMTGASLAWLVKSATQVPIWVTFRKGLTDLLGRHFFWIAVAGGRTITGMSDGEVRDEREDERSIKDGIAAWAGTRVATLGRGSVDELV
jgi:hypothetical protein